ncbi:TspO/MBR family protein [Glaciibacter sp. 2TAF33]|uniref:TspO/MBR family protein n=1 Tax=Glaciibacter sp. 2TAF33 TaxID=3233015 RepID=UPI003F8FE898
MDQNSARPAGETGAHTGAHTGARTVTGATRGDLVRQVVVVLTAVLAIVGSFIGSGAAGGTPIQDASDGALAADATLIAPGGPAFSIWSVIYAGLVAYAIWQALPAQRADARQRRLGYLVAASLVLNAAWILSVQVGLVGFSVPVIVLLLADLAWMFMILVRSRPKNLIEAVVTDGTMGLYLGWVCVATAANISAVLVAIGFRGFGLDPGVWAIIVIAVAGLAGIGLAFFGRGRLAPAAALVWGLVWVGVARLTGDLLSTPTAIAALVAAAAVLVITVALRVRTGIRAR